MADPIVMTGWGQITQPKQATPPYLDPIDMMEAAAREAGAMAGADCWSSIDTILVVRTQSRDLSQPGEQLASRLGIRAPNIRLSGIGGEVPQHMVNQGAGMLTRGEARGVLICGAETYYPRKDDDVRGEAALIQGIPDDYEGDDLSGSDDYEQRHGLLLPIHGFPLFENALWAKSGLSRDAWLSRVGNLWSRFSEVAANHPNAWTREKQSAERIITASADNRPICFPYTKRMVSLVMADLGSAVIMTTESRAKTQRDGGGKAVYFLGGAYAKDQQRFMADKADFTHSPALARVSREVQARAKIEIAELDGFDLYSCFPCAVNLARGQLGLSDDDPRPLTQTGGLGFFGGPGSNYALHGIASLVENIANGQLRHGMASALGWFMHKYAVGIYAAKPGSAFNEQADQDDLASPLTAGEPVARTETPSGEGTIETYTVIYARDHSPERCLVYGKTAEGLRFVANAPTDAVTVSALTAENCVGRKVQLSHDRTTSLNSATLIS